MCTAGGPTRRDPQRRLTEHGRADGVSECIAGACRCTQGGRPSGEPNDFDTTGEAQYNAGGPREEELAMQENPAISTAQRTATPRLWAFAPHLKRLYALPLLFRVLLANSVVILLGATLGTYLATRLQEQRGPLVLGGFVFTGLLVSVLINYMLLKLALTPLTRLRETMRQVQAGDLSLKAPITGLDPDADLLAASFNTMLEAIEDLSKTRASQILTAQEEERKRIARELHDETSQVLTSLLISLAVLEEAVTTPEAHQRISDTRALAHQTLRAVRNLSIDLRPTALDDLGLLPALRWYIKEYQQKCGVEVEFSAQGFKERLPTEIETALYRIVQESLTNTAKHAHARKVWITLTESGAQIQGRMHDDGRGFDAHTMLKRPWQDRGLGLAGMVERATLLDGTLEIRSQPGEGTTIEVTIPIAQSNRAEMAALPA
jgi:two-component system, NarL family, sensor histidine kinase UhpB